MPEDFDVTITPGAYLKLCRCAAGKSLLDVAGQFHVEPYRYNERSRVELLELIEADAQPPDLAVLVALRRYYPFDRDVLFALERLRQGSRETPPRICMCCSRSEKDPGALTSPIGDGFAWYAIDRCGECHRGISASVAA